MIRCINTFTKHHAFNTTVFSTKIGAEDPYAEQVMVMDTLDSIHEKQCLDCLDVKRDLNIPLKTKHGKEQIA
jgi:hypothetical protein